MRQIKIGCRGTDVQNWQMFLRGGQLDADGNCTAADGDAVVSDGIFGPVTDRATRTWQAGRQLAADGIVGDHTWAAAVQDGAPTGAVPTTTEVDNTPDPDACDVVPATPAADPAVPQVDRTSPTWPPRPDGAKPLVTQAQRDAVLGKLEYVSAPTASNPEAVHITNGWAADNIQHFSIPLLSQHPIAMHRLAGPQFQAWCDAIVAKGLGDRVISFAGCWVPRYVRGSRTLLSNHAYGSAIDINVPWNRRGHQSALFGQHGCVRELAEMCYDFGLFWGGHYRGAPEDGMHFEARVILTDSQLAAARAKYGC